MADIIPFGGKAPAIDRPVLDLSGPKLRASLEGLIKAAEGLGGIEKYAEAVKLKSHVFQELMGEGRAAKLDLSDFEQLVAYMSTVRRRVAKPLEALGWHKLRSLIADLLHDAHEPGTGDARLKRFCAAFPQDKKHRFVRDLGSEVLHNVLPEQYPLMNRWVWDNKANTGVIREIWHGDGASVDHMVIDVADNHESFLVLREELSQFLSDNGIFRDMLWYVDLICAQVYGEYIDAQGGTYLRTDFASESDPLENSRRILGLDGINPKTGRSRFKTITGDAHVIDDIKRLN